MMPGHVRVRYILRNLKYIVSASRDFSFVLCIAMYITRAVRTLADIAK